MADFLHLVVLPGCSLTLGFDLVFGLLLFVSSKNSQCNPLLKVSNANLVARVSLRSARVGRSKCFSASL